MEKRPVTQKLLILCLALMLACCAAHAAAATYTSELGARFGMTVQEVQDIEAQNGHELKGTYETADSFQLYYETGVHFFSLECSRMEYDFDVVQRLLFQVYYVAKGGQADYDRAVSEVTALYGAPEEYVNDTDKYSLLYEQIGRDDDHVAETHWLIREDGMNLGIDVWYNEYDTVFIMFYDVSNPASFGELPKTYSDDLGVSFSYPEGAWDSLDMSQLDVSTPAQVIFTLRSDSETSIQYLRLDLWESIKETYEPLGYTRKDIGESFMDDSVVGLLMSPIVPENLTTRELNGSEFKMFVYETESDGTDPVYYNSVAMNMKNGYLHMFQLSSTSKRDELQPVFEQMMATVTIR